MTTKQSLSSKELSGEVAQRCIKTATWLWIIVCLCLHLRSNKVQMSVPIYAELSPPTSHLCGASTTKSALGGDGFPAHPCSVILFHKAALTCRLPRPGIIHCGVWDTHPETCGANETWQRWVHGRLLMWILIFNFLFFLQEEGSGKPYLKPILGSGQETAPSWVYFVFACQAAWAALFLLAVTFISLLASLLLNTLFFYPQINLQCLVLVSVWISS